MVGLGVIEVYKQINRENLTFEKTCSVVNRFSFDYTDYYIGSFRLTITNSKLKTSYFDGTELYEEGRFLVVLLLMCK